MTMKLILRQAHVYLYVIFVAIFYFLFWPLFYFFSRKPSRYNTLDKLRAAWGFISAGLAGFVYKFEYEQTIDWSRNYIVCPNHTSNLDIAGMCLLVKNEHCFMGKEELLDSFVTRLFFKTVDIPVKRESKMSSFRAFQQAAERLKQGISLVIFPEGTIPPHYPPQLEEFKNGPFRLAIALKIPIIPVTSLNTWTRLWDDGMKYGSRPGVCNIFVHKPIETAHLSVDDADTLKQQVYDLMKKRFENS